MELQIAFVTIGEIAERDAGRGFRPDDGLRRCGRRRFGEVTRRA